MGQCYQRPAVIECNVATFMDLLISYLTLLVAVDNKLKHLGTCVKLAN